MAEHIAQCQCGALRLHIKSAPEFSVLCNCRRCQKRSGSPFGVGAYIKTENTRVDGAFQTWGRAAVTGRSVVNHFCPTCGTTVFWTLEMRPDYVGVAHGGFEDDLPMPDRAIWTQEAPDWVVYPDHMPQYEKATPDA